MKKIGRRDRKEKWHREVPFTDLRMEPQRTQRNIKLMILCTNLADVLKILKDILCDLCASPRSLRPKECRTGAGNA